MRMYGTADGCALVRVTPISSHSPRSLNAWSMASARASSISLPMSVSKITGRAAKQTFAIRQATMGILRMSSSRYKRLAFGAVGLRRRTIGYRADGIAEAVRASQAYDLWGNTYVWYDVG